MPPQCIRVDTVSASPIPSVCSSAAGRGRPALHNHAAAALIGAAAFCPHGFDQLGQFRIRGTALQPQSVIDGGGAADHGSGGNVVGDAALRDGDGSVADLDVAGDTDLYGENDVVAYVGGFGQASLGAEQRVVA